MARSNSSKVVEIGSVTGKLRQLADANRTASETIAEGLATIQRQADENDELRDQLADKAREHSEEIADLKEKHAKEVTALTATVNKLENKLGRVGVALGDPNN